MRLKLAIVLYLATLAALIYGWWPNIHKLAFVDGQAISAGWEALWHMFPLLALIAVTVGLAFVLALMALATWLVEKDEKETEAKHRAREQAIEERGQEIMARAREQVAEAEHEVAHHKQAAEKAKADEQSAKVRAKKTREESEQAHRNVRDQLKRLRRENAKLKGH